jgi:hypothetical protein
MPTHFPKFRTDLNHLHESKIPELGQMLMDRVTPPKAFAKMFQLRLTPPLQFVNVVFAFRRWFIANHHLAND